MSSLFALAALSAIMSPFHPPVVQMPTYRLEAPDLVHIEVSGKKVASEVRNTLGGIHIVRPDDTISLGPYGSLPVTGLTLEEAQAALDNHLQKFQPKKKKQAFTAKLTLHAGNSKAYYVIVRKRDGDQVVRLPMTGNETVLDAMSQIPGLAALAAKNIYIARQGAKAGTDSILPVDWKGITQHGFTLTNYQMMPGDRLYVLNK
jgi:polysaccharide biosynthesis/export protein